MLFLSAPDLDMKLSEFQTVFKDHRAHSSLDGRTSVQNRNDIATLDRYAWNEHCRGLYQTPTAA